MHPKNDLLAGVRKGIRQTEFCHYFRTRAFAGTEAGMCYDSRKPRIWWELRERVRPIGTTSKLLGPTLAIPAEEQMVKGLRAV